MNTKLDSWHKWEPPNWKEGQNGGLLYIPVHRDGETSYMHAVAPNESYKISIIRELNKTTVIFENKNEDCSQDS